MKHESIEIQRPTGALFSIDSSGQPQDAHLHALLCPEDSPVADESGIRIMMKYGYTREEASRLMFLGRATDKSPDSQPHSDLANESH